jgi:hypothetical protein
MQIESISVRILPLLRDPNLLATVESVFAEACNLVSDDGRRFALVSPRIGDGPQNAVVGPVEAVALLHEEQRISGDGRRLYLAPGFRLDLAEARHWDPLPRYERLAQWPRVVHNNLCWLRDTLPLDAPPASLLSGPAYHTQGAFGCRPAVALVRSQAASLIDGMLGAYHQGQLKWLLIYARQLAGLGPGLTPAGDDWLAGWMVGLRSRDAMIENDASVPVLTTETVNQAILRAIQGQTSELSLAFLAAAAEGAISQPWHRLLDALSNADSMPLREAAAAILRQGATSGADMLAGFLAAFEEGAEETVGPSGEAER